MGATAAIGSLIFTGLDTVGKVGQVQGQQRALRSQGAFEQKEYEQNALFADQQALDASRRGELSAFSRGAEGRLRVGAERAGLAASGVDIGTGSAVDVQTNEAGLSALDQATIRNNAAREAWGYNVQAADYRRRGAFAAAGANMQAAGLNNDITSTLIGGVANTYGLWRQTGGMFRRPPGTAPSLEGLS